MKRGDFWMARYRILLLQINRIPELFLLNFHGAILFGLYRCPLYSQLYVLSLLLLYKLIYLRGPTSSRAENSFVKVLDLRIFHNMIIRIYTVLHAHDLIHCWPEITESILRHVQSVFGHDGLELILSVP